IEGNQGATYELNNGNKPFNLIKGKFSNVEITAEESLGEHAVFERQIIAEMKYKAPIDYMLELIEQWLPLSNAIDSSQQLTKVLDEIEDLFHEREYWLEKGLDVQKKLGKYVRSSRYYQYIYSSLRSSINGYYTYTSRIRQDANREEDEEPQYEEQIISYIASVQRTVRSIEQAEQLFLEEAALLGQQSYGHIRKASAINNTIKIKYEKHQLDNEQRKSNHNRSTDTIEMDNDLDGMDISADEVVRDPAWFTKYETEIEEQMQEIIRITAEAGKI